MTSSELPDPPKGKREILRRIFSLNRPSGKVQAPNASTQIGTMSSICALSPNPETTRDDSIVSHSPTHQSPHGHDVPDLTEYHSKMLERSRMTQEQGCKDGASTSLLTQPQQLATTSHTFDKGVSGLIIQNSTIKIEMVQKAGATSDHPDERRGPDIQVLEGAHNIKIKNSAFTNKVVHKAIKPTDSPVGLFQNLDFGGAVLLILDKKRVPGAEADSSDREYAPRCHPGTRREIRETLSAWLLNSKRRWSFIWLSGPAGVGKSTIAQTFAEQCQELGYLGASFFFSKVHQRDSPIGLIATIAYQLACQHAGYNHVITRLLSFNPSILDKTLRVQFQKLLVEPLNTLTTQYISHDTAQKPLVIIIDGLDECNDERAQRELITLIGRYVQPSTLTPFPLLWLVCSRPEWHLKREFAHADPPIICSREQVTCDTAEDTKDIYYILKDGLQKIRDEMDWSLTRAQPYTQWPPEAKLQRLVVKVGGLPIFASTILRFISQSSGGLDSLLDACLLSLETIEEPNKVNPLEALDIFYRHIMLRVPQATLPTTKRILAFSILSFPLKPISFAASGSRAGSVSDIGRILGLERDQLYSALRNLHSVVDVPPSGLSHEQPLKFFHKSFPDFLLNPARSQSFAIDMDEAYYNTTISLLRWRNHFLQASCELSGKSFDSLYPSVLTNRADCPHTADKTSFGDFLVSWRSWDAENADEWECQYRIQEFVRLNCWTMCMNVDFSYLPGVMAELANFSFCHFEPFLDANEMGIHGGFLRFLAWLLKNSESQSTNQRLVRCKPPSEAEQALAKSIGISLPLLNLSIPDMAGLDRPLRLFSSHIRSGRIPALDEVSGMMWIGNDERAMLAFSMKSRHLDDDKDGKEVDSGNELWKDEGHSYVRFILPEPK